MIFIDPIRGCTLESFMEPFEATIKQLIKKIIYMFYQDEEVMVMEGFLRGENEPKTIKMIQDIIHLKEKNVTDSIGILKREGILSSVDEIDYTGWDPKKKMSQREQKNRTQTFYAMDYKVLFDSVRLKIMMSRKELQDLCGKDDNITYICENCQTKFKLIELVSLTTDGSLLCPECDGPLKELDIDDQVNYNKKRYQTFLSITQPILDQINKLVGGKVFEDAWENRIRADKMIDKLQYDLKQRRRDEHEQDRRMGYRIPHTQADLKQETHVHIISQAEKRDVDEETRQKIEEMNQEKEEPKEDHEIELSGVVYKLSEINDNTFENWKGTDEDFEKLNEFYEKYHQ